MSDEADVIAAFEALDAAFEARDVEAIVGMFADDPGVTFWGSALPERAIGRESLRSLLSRMFASSPGGSFRLAYSERRVDVVGDIAWVNAAGAAAWDPGDGTLHEIPYRITGILVRTDGGWRWHTYHGSEPALLDP